MYVPYRFEKEQESGDGGRTSPSGPPVSSSGSSPDGVPRSDRRDSQSSVQEETKVRGTGLGRPAYLRHPSDGGTEVRLQPGLSSTVVWTVATQDPDHESGDTEEGPR